MTQITTFACNTAQSSGLPGAKPRRFIVTKKRLEKFPAARLITSLKTFGNRINAEREDRCNVCPTLRCAI
jgi:hypothetical protein